VVASYRRCNSGVGVGSFSKLPAHEGDLRPCLHEYRPTEAVRAEIDELFGSGRDIAEVPEEVMRLPARLVLQQVLEEEVTSWLGRDWNSRAGGGRVGQRNGFGDVTVKTTAGPVSLKRPKLRNTAEASASQLLGRLGILVAGVFGILVEVARGVLRSVACHAAETGRALPASAAALCTGVPSHGVAQVVADLLPHRTDELVVFNHSRILVESNIV